jgi:hypothetical protein
MRVEDVAARVFLEMYNAERKFPTFPVDPIHAAAVVEEEAGELIQAALQFTYEGGSVDAMAKEAVQVGAMALRFLCIFEQMESRPSRQVETAPHTTQLAAVLHDARRTGAA